MGNKKRRRRRRRLRRSEAKAIYRMIQIILCAVVVILCVQFFLHRYIRKFDERIIIQGVSIGDTDVSGLNAKRAKEKIQKELSVYADEKVILTLEDGRKAEATLGELGLTIKEIDSVVQQAVDYGKKGNALSCYRILKRSQKHENKKEIPVTYALTEKSAKAGLNGAFKDQLNLPENARVTHDDSGVSIVEEKPGEVVDIKKTVKSINKLLEGKWDGKGGKAKAYLTYTDPKITKKDLKGMTDLLGSYTTFYGSDGSGRAQNIESGAKLINGSIIKPGEEFSADAAMRPYTKENGFTEAASYEDDKVVQSMGGGICQISTTLYNAVLYAELEVTERSPHTMLVHYVEPSQDAAIADDVKDLKFKNSLESSIYIESVLKDGCITFNIYGKETRDPGRTLDFISETTGTDLPDGKRYIATDDAIGSFYTLNQAQPAITAQLLKVVYQDGGEVSREVVNNSQYVPSKETIAVGTASDDPQASDRMNQAILSQDESQIMSTIQELTGNTDGSQDGQQDSAGSSSEGENGSDAQDGTQY